jgi:hypothetical protein
MQPFSALLACYILALLPLILGSQAASNAEYYLQTSVTNGAGDCGTNKGGLYVLGYHTGAGLTDAVLFADISMASKGFLNGTYQQFDYNTSFPWYMDLEYITYSSKCLLDMHCKMAVPKTPCTDHLLADWAPVQINAAEPPTAGFKLGGGQLLVSTHINFGGWLGKHALFRLPDKTRAENAL